MSDKSDNSTPETQVDPRAVAAEALETLHPFLDRLTRLSLDAMASGNWKDLMDGIATFTDALMSIKNLLKLGRIQKIAVLEADLLSIMQDILDAREKKDQQYLTELLEIHLPECLGRWKSEGIEILRNASA